MPSMSSTTPVTGAVTPPSVSSPRTEPTTGRLPTTRSTVSTTAVTGPPSATVPTAPVTGSRTEEAVSVTGLRIAPTVSVTGREAPLAAATMPSVTDVVERVPFGACVPAGVADVTGA
ncbi:hypothetical protein DEI83_13655 [Curtobacterium sp. MCBD17_021]|nr:hypothetical protein DEI83_13655 [Curtobacterium sp. MCBD17_021]